ncbi:hypothetical protein MRB53_022760 [Persea americana]|uniref:Uncharacterized protein n=1 Tax=Persea americana TaxID=3435 RepID=A0ACC2L7U8_PERAE|nr:hypothetical protein MRB53_022760 [Persea americana]
MFLLFLGFVLGALAVIAAEGLAIFALLNRLSRKKSKPKASESEVSRDLDEEQSLYFLCNKKGVMWVLESDKIPVKESPTSVPAEQMNKKEIVEVYPIKKNAEIKDHSLILTEFDGSQATIQLVGCVIVAVSASSLSSRKWAKRYPIKLENKKSPIYNGSNCFYIYLETSWEKESWCRALRIASCIDKDKVNQYVKLSEEFYHYLSSLNGEYPSFMKPAAVYGEQTDRESTVRSSSEEDMMPTSPLSLNDLSSHSQIPLLSDRDGDEKCDNDEGTLFWNLLFSRVFFDSQRSTELNNFIQARIQKTLSNMRTPSYIGGITCTGLDIGKLPPYIRNMRVLPMDMKEVWSMEVDIEYSGGAILYIETRLEVCEPDFQKGIENTGMEQTTAREATSDLLEGFEYYGDQLKRSGDTTDRTVKGGEGDKLDADRMNSAKNTSWTSTYVSRWKSILNSLADQVSQVPLSLAIRVTSFRGTVRLHIKPPPSDCLWFGFTSMPDIDWNLESAVGEHKITSSHIALLISNRFKTAIRETLVLPNCENISIPWMVAEKDDWVPRKVAPFIWVHQESGDPTGRIATNCQLGETKSRPNITKASKQDEGNEKLAEDVHPQPPPCTLVSASPSSSQLGATTSVSNDQSLHSNPEEELKAPLMKIDEMQDRSVLASREETPECSVVPVVTAEEQIPVNEDSKAKKTWRRARMMDLGKKMGEKLEEKRRHIEEKGRHIVEKMRGHDI